VALLEKRGFLYNHSGDFPQVILIVPSHVPNNNKLIIWCSYCVDQPSTHSKENPIYVYFYGNCAASYFAGPHISLEQKRQTDPENK
jgi:hypothetical protein